MINCSWLFVTDFYVRFLLFWYYVFVLGDHQGIRSSTEAKAASAIFAQAVDEQETSGDAVQVMENFKIIYQININTLLFKCYHTSL